MKSLFTLVYLCVFLACIIRAEDLQWWQTTIIYQILIPSFKDSNNDGIGDFKGATQRLPYLKDLGVGTIWLNAFQKSATPHLDFAIMDFKSIHPQYGTMADFEDFMTECKRLDLNVIMTFIPNHSSTNHDWFKKAVKKESPYRDYYIWKPSSSSSTAASRTPPCNWKSSLDTPAWAWNDVRNEYYYRAYYDGTADLNLRNPNVKKEMKEILEFWMSLGVKGFVIDTISYLFEDEKCLDEPTDKNKKPAEARPYTLNQKENLELLIEWRKLIDSYPSTDSKPRFLMVQAEPFDDIQEEYYGTKTDRAAHIVMNPAFLQVDQESLDAESLDLVIGQMLARIFTKKPSLWINWATSNSKIERVPNRYDRELVDAANMLVLTLPGTAITCYGEEIGMESFGQLPSMYKNMDTFGEHRTPFQWNDHPNAGFTVSEAQDTWLPVHSNYFKINMENQRDNPKSHLNNYKRIAQLRHKLHMETTDISTFITSTNVLVIARETSRRKKYIILMNLGTNSPCINFKQNILDIKDPYLVVHSASENSEYNINDNLNIDNCFLMRPKSSLLLMTSSSNRLTTLFGLFTLPTLALFLNT